MENQTQQPNQQPNQSQTPSAEQKREKNKRIAIILFALAAVVLVGGVLLLQQAGLRPSSPAPISEQQTPPSAPSPQPETEVLDTSDWQTYRNDEFGFEVKYPPGSEITETSYGPRIVLPLEEQGTNLNRKYFDIAVDGLSPYAGALSKTEQVAIGDYIFTRETRSGAAAGSANHTENYIITHEGKKYILSFSLLFDDLGNYFPSIRPEEFDREKESAIFDQILSMFRFVEVRGDFQEFIEKEIDSVATWKGADLPDSYNTDMNSVIRFSYPKNWLLICCGDTDTHTVHNIILPIPEEFEKSPRIREWSEISPHISVFDFVTRVGDFGNQIDVSAEEFYQQVKQGLDTEGAHSRLSVKNLHRDGEAYLERFGLFAPKYEGRHEGKLIELYLVKLENDVNAIIFWEADRFGGDFISEFLRQVGESAEEFDTSGWQTYRSDEFGFEVGYPTDWVFNERENRVSFKEVGVEYGFEGSPIGAPFSISVEDMPSQFNTIEEYALTLYRPNYNDEMVHFKVGGVQAVRLSDYLRTEAVLFYEGKLYSIYLLNIGGPEVFRTYLGILSTFRFIPPAP